MAEVAYSIYDYMMRLAREIDILKSYRITSVGSTTTLTCSSLSTATLNVYKYGIARVSGKGSRQISAQGDVYTTPVAAGGAFTLATALSSTAVAGEVLDLAWWNEQVYGKGLDAVKDSLLNSAPYWHREIRIDNNSNTISDGSSFTLLEFDQDTDEYTLPTDCYFLSRVGVQDSTDNEVEWIEQLDLWRTLSIEGGMKVKFYRGIGHQYLPEDYHGKTICLKYMAREPMPSTLTAATCQIPLEALATVAGMLYKRRELFHMSQGQRNMESVAFPQLQASAQEAWAKVGYIKSPLDAGQEWVLR